MTSLNIDFDMYDRVKITPIRLSIGAYFEDLPRHTCVEDCVTGVGGSKYFDIWLNNTIVSPQVA